MQWQKGDVGAYAIAASGFGVYLRPIGHWAFGERDPIPSILLEICKATEAWEVLGSISMGTQIFAYFIISYSCLHF